MAQHRDVEVWAGGGVVYRRVDGRTEYLLVRRERHNDWSFPKGKLDEGEDLRDCAVREVREETGMRCDVGVRLPLVTYRDRARRRKGVAYWLMTVVSGRFKPNSEVAAVGWFDLKSARAVLTYRRDRELLNEADSTVNASTLRL